MVKAAWNIFGKSYEYRRKYNEYKERRRSLERMKDKNQMNIFDYPEVIPNSMRKR